MAKFIIKGGRPLKGEVRVRGSKNSAFPVLAATILAAGPCIIRQVPRIKDVENFLKILKGLGAQIQSANEKESESELTPVDEDGVYIDTTRLDPAGLDGVLVRELRGSILIMGALLARFGRVKFPYPGGDKIGARPLDTHFKALIDMGASIKGVRPGAQAAGAGNEYEIELPEQVGRGEGPRREVILDEFSVTGTENALLAATALPGTTILKLAAAEPHVQDLCRFLQLLGVKVEGIGTHTLVIQNSKFKSQKATFSPIRFQLSSDYLEAGTFAVAAAATRGKVTIKNVPLEYLDAALKRLEAMGVNYQIRLVSSQGEEESGTLIIKPSGHLRSTRVQSMPYPGFPTDLQAPFGVLATQAQGTTLIHDPLYEGRMKYIDELKKMGANAIIADPHRALISGPTPLYGIEVDSLDIRAGATLVIAGLLAEGKTVINGAEIIDRGYEKIEQRLRQLGADIKRV